jgi:hypothetical protein
MCQWLSYFIKLLQWIILCNTFYTHPHSVSGFMPQFVTKSAYCTGFLCGANTTSVCIIYCVKFTYTILHYLSKIKTVHIACRRKKLAFIRYILTIFTHILSRVWQCRLHEKTPTRRPHAREDPLSPRCANRAWSQVSVPRLDKHSQIEN